MRDLIQYAIPGFIILLVAEVIVTAIQQKDYYDKMDTAGSLSMGIGNVLIGFVGKAIVFGAYTLVYQFQAVYHRHGAVVALGYPVLCR